VQLNAAISKGATFFMLKLSAQTCLPKLFIYRIFRNWIYVAPSGLLWHS
jgi:hypothetical protein